MKIAVIVPVHNGEKFLPEFLSCLMRQTMKEFGVYFVDDCSEDNTGIMLQKAVDTNGEFHYMRNSSRCGAAISRNRGIDCSQSEYVLCLDADDMIADDLLEQLEQAAYMNDADMVMLERGDFVRSYNIQRNNLLLDDDRMLYKKQFFSLSEQPEDFLIRCQNGTCDRMIKRELLDQYRIRFQDLPCSNDVFYTVCSTFAAKRIVHTQTFDFLYYRRVHSENGRISNSRDPLCAFQALVAIKDFLVRYGMWEEYCCFFWIFALDILEKQLFVCHDKQRQKQVYEYLQEEGLQLLGILENEFYVLLNRGYQRQYERLLTLPYEEKCFKDSMSFHALCEINIKRIADIFDYIEKEEISVGYWGVGRMREGFLSAAVLIGKTVDFLIDNNKEKQGTYIAGIKVSDYEDIYEQVGLIIVSNKKYYHEIVKQIKERNIRIKVLSIQEYLQSDLQLEEYLR